MINENEINKLEFDTVEFVPQREMYSVTEDQRKIFEAKNKTLSKKLVDFRKDFYTVNGMTTEEANDWIIEHCHISYETLRKTLVNSLSPTRNFLYKFSVGMKLPLDKANELFDLCGGSLSEKCFADFICINALQDGDSIESFIKEMKK